MRYIVDLEGHGKFFYDAIRALAIGYREPYSAQDLYERQKYVYTECASQVGTILSADQQEFLIGLTTVPNPAYFEHFDDFTRNPQIVDPFMNAFKVFAMGMYSRIGLKVGWDPRYDYHLEAVTEDYMVVYVSQKPQGIPT